MESRPSTFYRRIRQSRDGNDFYTTPPEAVRDLLAVEGISGRVLDPCCGTGNILNVLKEHRLSVDCNDLYDYGCPSPSHMSEDFTTSSLFSDGVYDAVVGNPPFKYAVPFIHSALSATKERNGKVAFLFRLSFLEGQARKPLFESTPLSRVWVFSRRIACLKEGVEKASGSIAFAWFVWDHSRADSAPIIGWI